MFASAFALVLFGLAAVNSAAVKQDLTDAQQEIWLTRSLDSRATGGIAAVNQSIAAIGAKLAAANKSVIAFDGKITGLLNVNDAVAGLGDQLNQTAAIAHATPVLSPTDSTAVGIQFLFLQPNINLLLKNLDGKQGKFDTALFGLVDTRSLIRDTLIIQQNTAAGLGNALLNVLDPSLRGIAAPVNQQIQGNFTEAVTAWKGRSGAIAIPQALVPAATKLLTKIGPALSGLLGGVDKSAAAAMDDIAENLVPRKPNKYCCGITQAKLDALGPYENDLTGVPAPLLVALKSAGILEK